MEQSLDDLIAAVALCRMDTDAVLNNLSSAAVSDLRTVAANIEIRIAAVEERLTARETAHHALVNQLNDLLGQMQIKLNGALLANV